MSLSMAHYFSRQPPIKVLLAIVLAVVVVSFVSPDAFPSFFGVESSYNPAWTKVPATHPHQQIHEEDFFYVETHHPPSRVHELSPDGLLKTNMRGPHPIIQLTNEAERKWNTLVNRQSKTLEQAVSEYKRRYHRAPPAGFDAWYTFARQHNFLLIDEFDQINKDITPLLLLPRDVLKQRLEGIKRLSQDSGLMVSISHKGLNSTVEMKGPAIIQERSAKLRSLILGFAQFLPPMEFFINQQDSTVRILGDELRAKLRENKELTEEELIKLEDLQEKGNDLFAPCKDAPALRERGKSMKPLLTADSHQFIHDELRFADFCYNAESIHLHGVLSIDHRRRQSIIAPEFVWGRQEHGGEVRLPAIQNFHPFTLMPTHPWAERTHEKVFWRGKVVGNYHSRSQHKLLGWQGGSHRTRAAFLFANESVLSGQRWASKDVSLLLTSSAEDLKTKKYSRAALNDLYTDIGLVGGAIQCDQKDGTCDEMEKQIPWKVGHGPWDIEKGKLKYVLDLDGNGLSEEFQRFLGLGSVVMKSTIFPLWNHDWLVPYYHYIPIQQDYSDVYDIMAFFAGPPVEVDGKLTVDTSRGHDAIAQKIGKNARRFIDQTWRWEDMQIYVYRLLLEYSRAISDDPKSMEFVQ
ncbi:glycosyltransferase family 90 protein [Sphaerobolus stellatus SS14]|nr:glycosyltransferase family 90 protein [Sphaerobolus stellatus SS14]